MSPLSNSSSLIRGVSRRDFLGAGATTAGAATLVTGFPALAKGRPPVVKFQHGVASGDPLPFAVVLWTRVTPQAEATPGSGLGRKTVVRWQVSQDPNFRHGVRTGVCFAKPEEDFTVKEDVWGLRPNTIYYYRFFHQDDASPIGRTKTAPLPNDPVRSLRFGLASCSNYEAGYFSAYRHLAARGDLDFVLHVGDYIYEYESGAYGPGPAINRIHDPLTEIFSLSDYRRRHALHKADADSQALHAAYPIICTWDDHEVANDNWRDGAQNHTEGAEGTYQNRRAAAYRAYFEWMPIRLPRPLQAPTRIFRQFRFGALAELAMLDLRQYRDLQPANGADPAKDNPDRVILDRPQLDWLKENLGGCSATWKLIGNSVMATPVDFRTPVPPQIGGFLQQLGVLLGIPFNVDAWDGYTDDRRELLDFLATEEIDNVTFLTGDIHSSWACEVPRDSASYVSGASPSVAVELVGTSITSDNVNEIVGQPPRNAISQTLETAFKLANPHVKLLEFDSHGYSVVDVTPERLQMDWYYLSERTDPAATSAFASSFVVPVGTNALQPGVGPLGPRA